MKINCSQTDDITFSVIVPVYNVEEYLIECIDSIINQSYKNFELIAVNDGSTDSSGEILKKYAQYYSNIKIINQENAGLSAARNTGLKNANGDYVLFCDSDDYISSNSLAILAEEIKHINSNVIVFQGDIFGDTEGKDENAYLFLKHYGMEDRNTISGFDLYNKNYKNSILINTPMMCLNRQYLLEKNLFFNEDLLHEDLDFYNRLIVTNPIMLFIEEILYHRRYRADSIMTTSIGARNIRSYLYIYKNMLEIATEEVDSTFAYVSLVGTQWISELIRNIDVENDVKETIKELYFTYESYKCEYTINELLLLYRLGNNIDRSSPRNESRTNKILSGKLMKIYKETQMDTNVDIGIYGTGLWTDIVLDAMRNLCGEISSNIIYIDSYSKSGTLVAGKYIVNNIDDIGNLPLNKILIISEKHEDEMKKILEEREITMETLLFFKRMNND